MKKLPKIVACVGPTASGKSALALEIAQRLPVEIISADSRQVYRMLDIGTAKPTSDELRGVPHHFINHRNPDQNFNAGDFQSEGRIVIEQILSRNKLPLIVGGTGLYVQAIVDGFFDLPDFSGDVRKKMEHRLIEEGKEALFKELQSVDPVSAQSMDSTKHRRVIRALEVFYETGTPISVLHRQHTRTVLYDARMFALRWSRSRLYERINERVDTMIASGFLEEVQKLLEMGYDDRLQSLQTVGYKEAFAYLRGEMSKERMIDLMKQNTRRFAKRQLTWFNRDKRIVWIDISDSKKLSEIADTVISSLET